MRPIWTANRCISGLLLLALVIACAPAVRAQDQQGTASAAEPPSVTKEKLEAIEKEIQTLRAEAARLSAQEDSILANLAQFDLRYRMTTHEIELLELKQQRTQEEIAKLQSQFEEQKKNLEQQKRYLSRRLVEAYKLGELNYLKLLLRVNATSDLLRSYQYITFLAKDDTRKVQAYRNSMGQMEEARLKLEQENRNLVLLKQDLEEAHRGLLRNKQEKMQLLAAIQDQREMHLSALNDLRIAAGQLQEFFSNVEPGSLSGSSLSRYKGFLDWPVRGRVIHGFGLYRHPRFGTSTVSNGIEIAAPEGTEVRAIFSGQVVFSEWFKGYGQAVILSHPDGFYTLYAHNSELLVRQGDAIRRGQSIAKVGATGSLSGPCLYFEIRKKDQPLNPTDWLRKLY